MSRFLLLTLFPKGLVRHQWCLFLLERDLSRFPSNFVRTLAPLSHYSLCRQNLTLNLQKNPTKNPLHILFYKWLEFNLKECFHRFMFNLGLSLKYGAEQSRIIFLLWAPFKLPKKVQTGGDLPPTLPFLFLSFS